MNYDQYLLNEAHEHDRQEEPIKTWLVVVDEENYTYSGSDLNAATEQYNSDIHYAGYFGNNKVELGWVLENDYDPNNFEYTYRLFNPTETFEI